MKLSVNGNVIGALVLLLILALSNVVECQGFNLGCFLFGCPPRNPPGSSPSPSRPAGMKVGFYKGLCPNTNVDIESILRTKVQEEFRKNPTILPALLRMQFHDSFVTGFDASILIDGPTSERKAGANLSVRGYDLIDLLKAIAEALCPGIVSCSDIIALATNEVIKLGGGPQYMLRTGRNDGLRSDMGDVDLPGPDISVDQCITVFDNKKFSIRDMVVLLGLHTVGISHCQFFENRIYNTTTTTNQYDKDMEPNLRRQLTETCPQGMSSNNFTSLDQNPPSSNIVDNSFCDQILKNRGILPIDQELARNPQTKGIVLEFAQNPASFTSSLANAMIKLQELDVLTGTQGEVRRSCQRFN